jgi:nucleoside-diphosphate-sugar epimerase
MFTEYHFDSVVHLAAIVGDPACAKQPELAERVNWEGSLRLLDASIDNHVNRFVFVSTCSNYGKMDDINGYVDEKSALHPVSLYAELKVKFEKVILNEIVGKNGFCPISLRFATVYGVSPRMRFDLTVNEFTKDLALKKVLEIFGEQFWRPYCHVRDVCRAIITVLECNKDKVVNNVFNVGDTVENYQKGMIVDEIQKIIPNAKVRYVRKDEDPRDYRVGFSKIAEDLGFKITKRVPDGIKEIKELIDKRILSNPDDAKYRNTY